MKCQTISLKYFFAAKGAIYYVPLATVIFSHLIGVYIIKKLLEPVYMEVEDPR